MQQAQTPNQNKPESSDLIGFQSKFLDDLAAPLRPYQQAYLDQCTKLSRIQLSNIKIIK
jgi:hypothetical protein